jgi:hypothetical protein
LLLVELVDELNDDRELLDPEELNGSLLDEPELPEIDDELPLDADEELELAEMLLDELEGLEELLDNELLDEVLLTDEELPLEVDDVLELDIEADVLDMDVEELEPELELLLDDEEDDFEALDELELLPDDELELFDEIDEEELLLDDEPLEDPLLLGELDELEGGSQKIVGLTGPV